MAEARCTDSKRGGECHLAVGGHVVQRGDSSSHMNVSGGEDAGIAECGKEPGRGPRAPNIEGICVRHRGRFQVEDVA